MTYCYPSPFVEAIKPVCLNLPKVKDNLTPRRIIKFICAYFDIREKEIIGPIRKSDLVNARRIAMVLIKQYFPLISYLNIGAMFNRDHSTVIYTVQTFEDLCFSNKNNIFQLEDIREKMLKVYKVENKYPSK